jgi:hypothetical protein
MAQEHLNYIAGIIVSDANEFDHAIAEKLELFDVDIIALEKFQTGLADDRRWMRGVQLYHTIQKILDAGKFPKSAFFDVEKLDRRTRYYKDLPSGEYIDLGEHHREDHSKWSAIWNACYNIGTKTVYFARSWAASWK